MKVSRLLVPVASPLYTGLVVGSELVLSIISCAFSISVALVRFPGAQQEIVPSSAAKMNTQVLPFPGPAGSKNCRKFPFQTIPSGEAGALVPVIVAVGIVTCGNCEFCVPVPSYSDEKPLPLSEIQNGPPAIFAIPHGLSRFGSFLGAIAALFLSETRLV